MDRIARLATARVAASRNRFRLALAVTALLLTPAPAAAETADWPSYLDGPSHSSYNAAATSITPGSIDDGDLQPVWSWTPPSSSAGGTSTFASPTVVDGVAYLGLNDGYFYAVDESTQAVLWSDFIGYDANKPGSPCGGGGIVSTATVAPDPITGKLTVYVFGQDGNLYALDAATGTVDWASVVDTPSQTVDDYFSWSSPLVANGEVYIGISSDCDEPLVPAGLDAFDQHTGDPVASWSSLPPGLVGASIWSSPTELPNGDVIVTTGNAHGDEQPLYNESIVDLGGATLGLQDFWQVPESERIGDGDFGGTPTVFTADLDGTLTPMVGACNKNGTYYAFKQGDLAGGPAWQQQVVAHGTECDAAAIWNGQDLIEGGGGSTTIDGTSYAGSVQALDPATGNVLWKTGLPGPVIGSASEDGGGVVAAVTFGSDNPDQEGVYLLDAGTGALIGMIPVYGWQLFSQPVFAGSDLLVAGADTSLTAYEVTTPGAPITEVSPSEVTPASSTEMTLTGSGFSGSPHVFVSGGQVSVADVQVVSANTLTFTLSTQANALQGLRNLTVTQPDSPHDVAMTCASCVSVVPMITAGASTTTAVGPSVDPALTGEPVTYTATVSPTPDGGIVSFTGDGGAIPGCESLAVNTSTGTAECTTTYTTSASHSITATYSGDASWAGSVSELGESVDAGPTATSVSSSSNPAVTGATTTYTASVTPQPDGGTVAFADAGTTIAGCSAVTISNDTGDATCTTTLTVGGPQSVIATYSGDANWQGSASHPLIENVNAGPTSTQLSSSADPALAGTGTTYSATVAPVPDGGTIQFTDGGEAIGGCSEVPVSTTTGTAACATSYAAAGSHAIVATYSGDGSWAGSASATLTETVNAGASALVAAAGPKLGALRVTPESFRAATHGPSTVADAKTGAIVSYTLSEAASVTFTVHGSTTGRISSTGVCVAHTHANNNNHRCTLTVDLAGRVLEAGYAGANSFRFTGRLDGKSLLGGSYTLIATPAAGGVSGAAEGASFRIAG